MVRRVDAAQLSKQLLLHAGGEVVANWPIVKLSRQVGVNVVGVF
jgi:hypothetical protein